DAVHEHDHGDDDEPECQGAPGLPVEVVGATNQPEGGEGQLDEAAHPPHALRPGFNRAEVAPLGGHRRGHEALLWHWYQAIVSLTATSSGVPATPKVDWNLVVSRT